MLVAVTLIGILGVVKQTNTTNSLLVFFSVVFSERALSPPELHEVSTNNQSSACNALDRPDGVSLVKSPLNVFDPTPPDSLRRSLASAESS